jgi:hypothetical protein
MSLQSDDMDALDVYMKGTPIVQQAARALRDSWIQWYDKLGWWNIQFNEGAFDEARNRKHAFDEANAKDAEELKFIREMRKTALTSEEARGQPRRMLDDGSYAIRESPLPGVLTTPAQEGFFPLRVKIAIGLTAAAGVTLVALKRIYLDPFLPKKRA